MARKASMRSPTAQRAVIDPYATLGISSCASADEIRAAWKAAALKTHPDKLHDDGTQFRAVQAAYEVLRTAPKVVKGTTSDKRESENRQSAEKAAARKRDFEARAAAFWAKQQAKRREYEAGRTRSPADDMAARARARQKERYMACQRQAEQQTEREEEVLAADAGLAPGRTRGPMWRTTKRERPTKWYASARASWHVETEPADAEVPPSEDYHFASAAEASHEFCMALAFLTHSKSTESLSDRVAFVLQQGISEACVEAALQRADLDHPRQAEDAHGGEGGTAPAAAPDHASNEPSTWQARADQDAPVRSFWGLFEA